MSFNYVNLINYIQQDKEFFVKLIEYKRSVESI